MKQQGRVRDMPQPTVTMMIDDMYKPDIVHSQREQEGAEKDHFMKASGDWLSWWKK